MANDVFDYDWKSMYPLNHFLKGENEMNIKETLNKIYGKSAAANAPVEDNITQEDIMNATKTVSILPPGLEKEEWIWVKGFKGIEKDMSCKGYRYELGTQFDLVGIEPDICHSGFHFCKDLKNVFRYYSIGDGNRFFEVEALVKKSDLDPEQKRYNASTAFVPYTYLSLSGFSGNDDKYAAKSIRFIRELTVDEIFEAVPNENVQEWTYEQKKRAMETSIAAVRMEIREFELCAAGYSPAFSKYIARDTGRYKRAIAMASLPDVSMDVKVMAIFMDNQDD